MVFFHRSAVQHERGPRKPKFLKDGTSIKSCKTAAMDFVAVSNSRVSPVTGALLSCPADDTGPTFGSGRTEPLLPICSLPSSSIFNPLPTVTSVSPIDSTFASRLNFNLDLGKPTLLGSMNLKKLANCKSVNCKQMRMEDIVQYLVLLHFGY